LVQNHLQKINELRKTKYKLEHRLLDAASYGVPQRRQRAILIARRDGKKFFWPTPTHEVRPVRAYDALHSIRAKAAPSATGKWADLLPSIPEGQNYLWHTSKGGGKKLFGYRTRYWSFLLKLAKSEPAWTLSAFPGPATGPFHWNNRPLTIQEMLRLQSFPASWRISGDLRAQVRQVGNATPPLLAETIARAIGEQVFAMKYSGPCRLRISRTRIVPPPELVCPIPKKYERFEGDHQAHPGTGLGPSPRIRWKRSTREGSESKRHTADRQRRATA
jgi:DNA (cytosine-5)-methyltransferase 1